MKPSALFTATLAAVLTLGLSTAPAQTPIPAPTVAPSAPLPAALTHATKLFLGNAGDQENADCLRAYNGFYAGLAGLGRFTLVDDPNQADLVLELHYEIALGQSVGSSQGISGNSIRQFRVVLLDPRSHAVLWSLTERTNYAIFQKNRDKNLDQTVATLLNDFNLLVSAVPPNNKSVVTHD
jgi:hypothetical protein